MWGVKKFLKIHLSLRSKNANLVNSVHIHLPPPGRGGPSEKSSTGVYTGDNLGWWIGQVFRRPLSGVKIDSLWSFGRRGSSSPHPRLLVIGTEIAPCLQCFVTRILLLEKFSKSLFFFSYLTFISRELFQIHRCVCERTSTKMVRTNFEKEKFQLERKIVSK